MPRVDVAAALGRAPGPGLIDVGVDRIGTTLGSVALLAIVQLSIGNATRIVLIGTIAMAAFAWLISARFHDGYIGALAASLKSGAVALGDDDALNLTTKKTLAETTALLDRDMLLARIEQFQKAKLDGDIATPSTSGASGGVVDSVIDEPNTPPRPVDLPTDAVLARAAELRSGDVARARAALNLGAPLSTPLVPFVIPLLARDALARDAVRALRKIATHSTGQLLDSLLDAGVDPRVRRRIPRVLKVCRTQRAATGLMMALADPRFDVRVQVGLALAQMLDEAHLTVARDEVFDVIIDELTARRANWGQAHDELQRGLAHVFTVLGLVLEREPLSITFRAMRADDATLRGTAHEYLDVVLPPHIRDVLVPLLCDGDRAAKTRGRGSRELADELLRSSASLTSRVGRES